MKKIIFIMFVLCYFLGSFKFLNADYFKGYIIPEYYYVLSSENQELKSQNGFWFRRIYFGYNSNLGNEWSIRLRIEMNNLAFEKGKVFPYLKNAQIKKKLSGELSLLIGLIEPPSFNKIEKFWGYRFIEKTPADFFKFASSRDTGVAVEGKMNNGLIYSIMFGNYGSNKGEWNRGKALYGRIGLAKKHYYLELNSYYSVEKDKSIYFISSFFGLKNQFAKIGLNYIYKKDMLYKTNSTDNTILSVFTVINSSKKSKIFIRYDRLSDYNFKDISGYIPVFASLYKSSFFIAGLDLILNNNIRISPNIKYVFYRGENATSGDFYFNITGKISFKSLIKE